MTSETNKQKKEKSAVGSGAGPKIPLAPDTTNSSGPQVPTASLLIKEMSKETIKETTKETSKEKAESKSKTCDESKEKKLRGELVKNNNFERWGSGQSLYAWEGYNFAKSEDALTDKFAVRLGNNPNKSAQLFQNIKITSGCFFELKFSMKLPESLLERPTVKVIWLDQNKQLLDTGLNMKISKDKKDYYGFYARITSRSPEQAAYARLSFEKKGYGALKINEVSLVCC